MEVQGEIFAAQSSADIASILQACERQLHDASSDSKKSSFKTQILPDLVPALVRGVVTPWRSVLNPSDRANLDKLLFAAPSHVLLHALSNAITAFNRTDKRGNIGDVCEVLESGVRHGWLQNVILDSIADEPRRMIHGNAFTTSSALPSPGSAVSSTALPSPPHSLSTKTQMALQALLRVPDIVANAYAGKVPHGHLVRIQFSNQLCQAMLNCLNNVCQTTFLVIITNEHTFNNLSFTIHPTDSCMLVKSERSQWR
jgi:hypothetical protein